jgi:hypothetical protein
LLKDEIFRLNKIVNGDIWEVSIGKLLLKYDLFKPDIPHQHM